MNNKPLYCSRAVQQLGMERIERMSMPVTETGCWLWLGAADRYGYGSFKVKDEKTGKSKHYRAYRWSYELFIGEIPEGFVIDHKCHVPACINPAHLEAVTQAENARRTRFPGKAITAMRERNLNRKVCRNQKHPWVPENIRISPKGGKTCKACEKESRLRRVHTQHVSKPLSIPQSK